MIAARPIFTLYPLMLWLGAVLLEMQLKTVNGVLYIGTCAGANCALEVLNHNPINFK